MSTASNVAEQAASLLPPYPAAINISGANWRSGLARNGRIVLARPVIQLGRMEGNDIVLADPLASRHHALIRWAGGGYELEDLGSANGTSLDGQRVQGRAMLRPGQTIRIGGTDLHFNLLDHSGHAGAVAEPATQTPPTAKVTSTPPYTNVVPGTTVMPGRPMPSVPAPSPAVHPSHPYYAIIQSHENSLVRLLRTQLSKRYWRVFVLGFLGYIAVSLALAATANLHLVPLAMLLASGLVPVVFVIFCWEQSAFADMPLPVVGATFASGAILGLTIAAVVEPMLIPANSVAEGIGLMTALLVGLVEETAKVVSIAWFLRDRRLRSELDGLILGAAAGMGFAALETAGYGFVAFLVGFTSASQGQNTPTNALILAGVQLMNHQLLLRMALAIFGHGVWTAIVCAAIWRDRGQATFRLTPGVLLAFGIAVSLHALWDWSPLAGLVPADASPLAAVTVIFGWFLLIGGAGLLVLRFFLRESLRRAKMGPGAPPPPPLLGALLADTMGSVVLPSRAPWPQTAPAWGAPPPASRVSGRPSRSQQPQSSATRASAQPSPQAAPAQHQPQPQPPIWPLANANAVPFCRRCWLTYPSGATVCSRCGGPLTTR